ncbi:hypothetical protein GCM10007079_13640 [Nocardiopsis terrae]|uniref:Glycosyl transferases group 1 n=1 Tax=Nocardiopsis terrae TaxID=372655 RepID=A0ABR9HC10_9ACTN|nr:glycosyltransferase family 1 protein [Nocardiopsis terrae]MBE1456431.1 hypothetical protein [Nocardiopsis terrae]GHC76880.1 hypothetical protein GCM10007079_13640 [Nocardiopsis terrae]
MRLRSISRKQIVLAAVGLAAVAVAVSPPGPALALAFAGLALLVLGTGRLVEGRCRHLSEELGEVRTRLDGMARERRDELSNARRRDERLRETIQEAADSCADRTVEGWVLRERSLREQGPAPTRAEKRLTSAQDLLWAGYSTLGTEQLRSLGSDDGASPGVRAEAHKTLSNWHRATGGSEQARNHAHLADLAAPRDARGSSGVPLLLTARVRPPAPAQHFDVVVMSDFRLPGGTTGSNLEEITAQRRAGLRTGLVHHPALHGDQSLGVNPRVLAAVDNDLVRFVAPDERVTCDLLVVRFPLIGQRPLDVLPSVEAARRIVVLNQTPLRRYGVEEARNEAWDVARCAEGFRSLLGEHSWYPVSPRVREAMVSHHAAEMAGIPLADEDWTNIIDLDAWRRESRRAPDGRVLLGRHSRDHRDKWPGEPAALTAAYPGLPGWETHVLGGAKAPERVLGVLPDHWRVRGFDSGVRDFLHGLDAYVYFTREGHLEPFGRAPLEAIAAGLPTLLPHSFEPVFGAAALYTDPAGVRAEVEALMADGERYEHQVERGHEVLRERFGHRTHLRRLARLGVRVPAEFLETADPIPVP